MNNCPIRANAVRMPHAPALITQDGAVDYAALDTRVTGTAAWLASQGLRAGDRLALSLPPDAACHALLFAAFRMGLVACPVDPNFPPGYAAGLAESLGCEAVVSCRGAWLGCRRIAPPPLAVLERTRPTHVLPVLSASRPAAVLWTSGSSAEPKAAVLRFSNLCAAARLANAHLALGTGARWLLSLSPHHAAGLGILFRCAMAGAAAVLPAPGAPLAENIQRHGVTHVSLVAVQLRRLLDTRPGAPQGLQCLLLGGGPVPEQLLRRAQEAGLPVVYSYGMTETVGLVTATRPGHGAEALCSVGRPLASGALALSEEGEILLRGAAVFAGYARNGGVESALDENGWFHTGDLGRFDAAGGLHLTGRIGNCFTAGGENVDPEEIEAALLALPEISGAVVVPVPDTVFGNTVAAFLDCGGAALPPLEVIRAQLSKKLPKFKIPRALLPWPEGATGALGKPRRAELIRRAAALLRRGG